MPGLLGIVSARGADDAARRYGVALDRMRRHAGMEVSSFTMLDGRGVFGHVRLPFGPQASTPQAASNSIAERQNVINAIFHGVLYNAEALARDADAGRHVSSVPSLIQALYLKYGAAFVERLEGEFLVAVIDEEHQSVLVATDTVGNYPLYWRKDEDGLIVCSDLSALLRATPSASHLNLRAVADYFTLGAVLSDKTLVEGVAELDPGTVLLYDVQRGSVSERVYSKMEDFFHEKVADHSEYMHAVQSAFQQAVRQASRADRTVGLSLSGGLDSRAILSAICEPTTLCTYTLGVDGCADQVIAQQLADITGTQHVFFRLDSSYLRDFLPNMAQMVSITDGMYLSHGLTEMLAIQFLGRTGIGVLLRGHGGELAKAHLAWPLHTDPRVYDMRSLDELVPYLSARANYVTPTLPLSDVLSPEAAVSAGSGARDSFASILRGTELSPADACSYLYLRELNRRFTVPSLELFRTRVEVRLPYLAPAFLKVLLRAPSRWRDTTGIHRSLTAAGNAKLLRVRNSNTGARANAGSTEEFVLDKFNTVFKRLNIRGYRHYHNFDTWMRRMLLESVESELLAPGARVQAYVPNATLSRLIRESREGAADRSYLLQILLILELWQRENSVEAVA